jgi:hypothetical protein
MRSHSQPRRPPVDGGASGPFGVTGRSFSGASSAPKLSIVQSSGNAQGRGILPSRSQGTSPLIFPGARRTNSPLGSHSPSSLIPNARKDALRPLLGSDRAGGQYSPSATRGTSLNQLLAGSGAARTALDALLGEETADSFARSPSKRSSLSEGGPWAGPRVRVSADAGNRQAIDATEHSPLIAQRRLRADKEAPHSQAISPETSDAVSGRTDALRPIHVRPSSGYRGTREEQAYDERRVPAHTASASPSLRRQSPREFVDHTPQRPPATGLPGQQRQVRGSNLSGLLALGDKQRHQQQSSSGKDATSKIPLFLGGLANSSPARSPRMALDGGSSTSKAAPVEALTRALHLQSEPKAQRGTSHTFQNSTPRGATARRSAESTPLASSRPGSRGLPAAPRVQDAARDESLSNAETDRVSSRASSSNGDGSAEARQKPPVPSRTSSSGSRAQSAKGQRSDGAPHTNSSAKRLRSRPATGGFSRQPSPATLPAHSASPSHSRPGSSTSMSSTYQPPTSAGAAAAAAARALAQEAEEARAAAAMVAETEAVLLRHSLQVSAVTASGSDGEGAERTQGGGERGREEAGEDGGKDDEEESGGGLEGAGAASAGGEVSGDKGKKGKPKVVKAKKKESVFLGYCSNTSVCLCVCACLRAPGGAPAWPFEREGGREEEGRKRCQSEQWVPPRRITVGTTEKESTHTDAVAQRRCC